jgi:hypothetical protein
MDISHLLSAMLAKTQPKITYGIRVKVDALHPLGLKHIGFTLWPIKRDESISYFKHVVTALKGMSTISHNLNHLICLDNEIASKVLLHP